ncbi:hypothetical protein EJ02DRAFT_134960 [Clathrospora elynae]|uniref:Uncharacterized protein n=1 Tax=Clathrospora elynae TaxID=706981 RepID=A0A6A5S6R5_9PLEO|nr:hypothetical protein EJ02DRAFT_134960 [Clathrospora elynae]
MSCITDSFRKTELTVIERNRRVSKEIDEWKKRPSLVFCVSARDYQRNTFGYQLRTSEILPVSAELTSLLLLKKFVGERPANEQQQELVRWVLTMKFHLSGVEIACQTLTTTVQLVVPGRWYCRIEVRRPKLCGHLLTIVLGLHDASQHSRR